MGDRGVGFVWDTSTYCHYYFLLYQMAAQEYIIKILKHKTKYAINKPNIITKIESDGQI